MLRFVVTLCILLSGSDLLAQPLSSVETPLEAPRLQITWEGPSECPTAEDVRRAVQREILRTHTGVPPQPVEVSVKVLQTDDKKFVADITFPSQSTPSKRKLHAGTCHLLADATAMLIALVATRDSRETTADVTPPQNPNVVTAPAQPNQNSQELPKDITPLPAYASKAAKFTKIPESPTLVFVAPQGQFVTGRTPTPLVGAALSVGVEWRSLRVSAMTEWSLKRSIELTSVSQSEAVFRSFGGGFRACYSFPWGSVEAGPCLGGQIVRIEGTGKGRVVSSTDSSAEFEGWGGLEGRWNVGRMAAVFGAEVGLPAFRHRYVIRSADESTNLWSFDTQPVRIRILLGLALRF